MKRTRLFILIVSAAAACFATPGCDLRQPVYGNGDVVTTDLTAADFSSIAVEGIYTVHVVQGAAYSVKLTTDTNIAPLLAVTKNGAELVLDQDESYNLMPTVLIVEVTMPALGDLAVAGDVDVSCSGFGGQPVNLTASGLTRITFSDGSVSGCDLTLSGDTTITMAANFTVSGIDLNASGLTRIVARMDGSGGITGNASGDTRISYYGTPTAISVSSSGLFSAQQLQ